MKLHLLFLLAVISTAHSYHVLVSFIIPSHSHNTLGKGIVDALLNTGHTVTWITPYPEKVGKNKPKNLNVLGVSHIQKYLDVDMTDPKTSEDILKFTKEISRNVTTGVFTDPKVQDVIVNTQFDAVVTELFFNDALAGLAAVQQAPWIIMSSMQVMPTTEAQVDEIRSPNTVPAIMTEVTIPMTLKERVVNLAVSAAFVLDSWLDLSITKQHYVDLFGPLAARRNVKLPAFDDAFYNVSILFTNTHESLYPVFSVPPNVIGIAGYHIEENPPSLPKDLQDLLDNSKQGVIYFSLGSVLRSSALKPHTKKALLAKFAALTYTVLWKFEEDIKDLPPNVHVRKWMPQLSILLHPNVKVFITHGGQLSCLEAIKAGVPIVAVPVFADQPSNAANAKRAGFALTVTFGPDMAEELDERLREVLNNPIYTEKAKYLSQLFRDRPVPPAKLVSHYIELAIKTKVHPNVKVFITHGGQLSCLEAIKAGVPIVAVPVFADQPSNAANAKRAGFALTVTFGPDMAEELDERLREVLNNPIYTEKAKYLSQLFRDRPVPPAKLVSHYIELAIKTKGAYHLRSPSLQYSWVERWLLDLLLIVLVILSIFFSLLWIAFKKLFGKNTGGAKVKRN